MDSGIGLAHRDGESKYRSIGLRSCYPQENIGVDTPRYSLGPYSRNQVRPPNLYLVGYPFFLSLLHQRRRDAALLPMKKLSRKGNAE